MPFQVYEVQAFVRWCGVTSVFRSDSSLVSCESMVTILINERYKVLETERRELALFSFYSNLKGRTNWGYPK